MAASIKLKFFPKTGDKKEFSYPTGVENNPDLKTMISSLRKLQENANKLLTEIVDKERLGQNHHNSDVTFQQSGSLDEEMDDDDDEESDNDNEAVREPESKKPKT